MKVQSNALFYTFYLLVFSEKLSALFIYSKDLFRIAVSNTNLLADARVRKRPWEKTRKV